MNSDLVEEWTISLDRRRFGGSAVRRFGDSEFRVFGDFGDYEFRVIANS